MDKYKVEENIKSLREKKASCSQATLIGIARSCDPGTLPDERTLNAMASGLRGGIGGTRDEGSCGALTAATIALGLLCPDDNVKATRLSRQLYEHFKDHFGTVICGKMTQATGTQRCTDCCLCAGKKVAELYNSNIL